MKREARLAVHILLGVGCAAFPALAQNTPQENVTVVLLNAHEQPPQPVKAVRVSLSYLDSSVLVTDAQQVTNSQGQALLLVSPGVSQRGDLRIVVTGASDLVIYQPADGQLPALPATVKVSLLPKGSPALLGPAQIEAMLHRTLLRVNNLQKEVSALKQTAQSQGPDLGAAIAEWAQSNGFSADHVNQQVQQWAQGIQGSSTQATADQKALSELALKHYASAAQLFSLASDADRQQIGTEEGQEQALAAQVKALEAAQQALLDKLRSPVKQMIDHSEQAAGAYQLNLQYHKATQTLESAEATAAAEYKKHPDDKGFHELWLRALSAAANAREAEGTVSPADLSLPLLAQSVADQQVLMREYAALGDRREGATAQMDLGGALGFEGERASPDQAADLLDQAVQAYRSALQVFTRAELPQDWAKTQGNLGGALKDESENASADKAAALLDQAVQAYQNALQVFTKGDQPREWASAQLDLGDALTAEGELAGGDKSAALFDQAAQACGRALEVFTKTETPQYWAVTQVNLGKALEDEGELAGGDKAAALFDQAVQADQNALQIFTMADMPQEWAATQVSLGNALQDEAGLASGKKPAALLDQAVQAYQSALQVFTKAGLPQYWAGTQKYLGTALEDEAERASEDKADALFSQAVQAYRNALEVYTKTNLPQSWASLEDYLGAALLNEAQHTGGDKAAASFDQAAQAFQNALEVYTKTESPQNWAEAQVNLLEIDLTSGHFAACLEQAAILTDDALPPAGFAIRDTMRLACQWGAGDKSSAAAAEKALSSHQPVLEAGFWDLGGIVRFISTSPAFTAGRASWVALFTAVENGESAGMTAALHQLEPILQQ